MNVHQSNFEKLKPWGFGANLSYALGFMSVIASIDIWFTQGGTESGVASCSQFP